MLLLPEIAALLTLGFKRAYERAVEWLKKVEYKSVLIDLPEDFEPFLRTYLEGECELEEAWRSLRYLTGLHQPFINSLRYQMDPLFEYLSKSGAHPEEICCYQDLSFHVESFKIAEKVLLLEFRQRAVNEIKIENWKRLLLREAEHSKGAWRLMWENIKEKVKDEGLNVLLYGGYISNLRNMMREESYSIRIICLKDYWKSPLDVLRTIFAHRQVNEEELIKCLKEQMKYIDLVISNKNIDEAHEKWNDMISMRLSIPQEIGC